MPFNEKILFLALQPAPPGLEEKFKTRFPDADFRWVVAKFDYKTLTFEPVDNLPQEIRENVTVLSCYNPPSEEALKHVKYVQLVSAGSDLWQNTAAFKRSDVAFCSATGCNS